MIRHLYSALACIALAMSSLAQAQIDPASAAAALPAGAMNSTGASCKGRLFNPVTDTDWNNLFPITMMGIDIGGNGNPPLMKVPPVCMCPSVLGIPSPGVGISYWQPLYISEVEKTAGCSASLGGLQLLKGFSGLNSEQAFHNTATGGANSNRMQMHWYEYPVFGVMNAFKSLACRNGSGFNLGYLSEIDPTWQNDVWAGIFNPEAAAFSNLVAQSACAVDSVAASVRYPVDPLFWCAGSWGGVYPLAGTANQATHTFQANNLILAKFLARQARLGLAWTTIGPEAICQPNISPIWVKSQYRVNQVYPIARKGAPLVIGAEPVKQSPTNVTNPPGMDSTVNLIWQGQECCIRTF